MSIYALEQNDGENKGKILKFSHEARFKRWVRKQKRKNPALIDYPYDMSLERLLRDEDLLEDITEIIEIESYL